MNTKDIEILNLNPFWCSQLIPFFLKGFLRRQTTIEYLYLLLPSIFSKNTREILNKSTSRSSFSSTFIHNNKGHIALLSTKKNYSKLKELLNHSLIVAFNEGIVEFNGSIIKSKCNPKFQDEKDLELRSYYRAAHYLGIILSKETPLEIYTKFNIKEI